VGRRQQVTIVWDCGVGGGGHVVLQSESEGGKGRREAHH